MRKKCSNQIETICSYNKKNSTEADMVGVNFFPLPPPGVHQQLAHFCSSVLLSSLFVPVVCRNMVSQRRDSV